MFVKNKALDKIIKIYLSVFFIFSIICVNIVIDDIFRHFNIYSSLISYITLIVTICSYLGLGYMLEKEMNKEK